MSQDHPRVCGEKKVSRDGVAYKWGSPPRMRGKAALSASAAGSEGITPAYAGKSRECAQGLTPVQDHPRVCGEKLHSVVFGNYCEGSPPRMRGKVLLTARCSRSIGITPAYAGKSLTARGAGHQAVGSPPRMRGKDLHRKERARCGGITPAYAGKSAVFRSAPAIPRDHPRVCGEKCPLSRYPL